LFTDAPRLDLHDLAGGKGTADGSQVENASADSSIPVGESVSEAPAAENAALSLPVVSPEAVPKSWQKTPLPLSGGRDVYVYRGFAKNAEPFMATVVREGEIGGILSRRVDAAHDAIFNQVERDPVLAGPERAGVVRVRIPAAVWDELVRTNSISERGEYPGFSRKLNSSEIRVNSTEAGRVINNLEKEILPPDPYYDFRPGAARPSRPLDSGDGEEPQ
jgi:hypothetical protein